MSSVFEVMTMMHQAPLEILEWLNNAKSLTRRHKHRILPAGIDEAISHGGVSGVVIAAKKRSTI